MKIIFPNNIEKDIQSRFLKTGLIDMVFGIYFIMISLFFDVNQLVKVSLMFGLVVLYNFVKSKIIEPRIGICRFSINRSRIFQIQNIVIASLTLLLVVLIILSKFEVLVIKPIIITVALGVIVLFITIFMSMIFNYARLIVYGSLLAAVIIFMNPLVETIGETLAEIAMLIIPGAIIFIYGGISFAKFIENNSMMKGSDYE